MNIKKNIYIRRIYHKSNYDNVIYIQDIHNAPSHIGLLYLVKPQ